MDNLLLPQAPTQSGISIRPMALNDIETVAHVDRLSFAPIWQFSAEYIRIAYLEEGLSLSLNTMAKFVASRSVPCHQQTVIWQDLL